MNWPTPLVPREVVEQVLDRDLALHAAREAARLQARDGVISDRLTVQFPPGWIRVLVAALPERDLVGYKEFHVSTSPTSIRYQCHLFRMSTGEPLGALDADLITRFRTAAAAVLAIEHVFGDEPIRIAVIGSGGEASSGLAALSTQVRAEAVQVFSRDAVNRTRFVEQARRDLGLEVSPATSVGECVRDADLIYAATNSGGEVVLEKEQLAAASMLATLGSTTPFQREVSGSAFQLADVLVVDTLDALDESGDLVEAGETGALPPSQLLGDFIATPNSRARGAGSLVIYKSIGAAVQDVVLAAEVLQRVQQ